MNIAPRSRFLTAALMATVMTATSLPVGMVKAGMITTEQIIEPTVVPDRNEVDTDDQVVLSARERVEAILAKADVRAEMVALGVDPEEAEARVASMTESELAMIAGRLDQLPAGEGLGVGTALIILFVVFGVAVILDALGMLNIFPFVCSGLECKGQQASLYPQQSTYPEPAAGPDDYLYQDERAPAYRSERRRERADPYARRRQPRYETEQYYEPAPVPQTRNYYEERFGTQRQIR